MEDIFKTKPVFINDIGTSFWLDKDLTEYARSKELKGVKVFYIKDKVGYKTRVIIKGQEYIYENQRVEDIAIHLDIMSLI